VQVSNTAEGSTNGTAATTANTGGVAGNAFNTVNSTSATVEFSSLAAIGGALSYRTAIGGTSAVANFGWNTTALGNPTRVYGRIYFRLPNIVINRELIRWRRGTTQVARLRVDVATGVLELRQGNNAAPTTGGTGAVTLAADTWYRVEWDVQAGTLTNTIYLYLGDSTTPLETITGNGVFATAGAVNEVMFGQFTATTNVGNLFFDDIVVNDTGLPGPAPHSVAYSRSVDETLVMGDVVGARRAQARGAGETSVLADTWARATARLRGIAEGLGLPDTVTRGAIAYARNRGEPLAVADAGATLRAMGRSVGEPVTVVDSGAAVRVYARAVAEPVAAADTWSRSTGRARPFGEALQALDVPTRTLARPRGVAEPVTVADAVGRQVARSIAGGEAITVVDAAARSQGLAVSAPSTLTSSDAWSYTILKAIAASNTLSLVDAVGRQVARPRPVGEALVLGHAIATGVGVSVGFSEVLMVGDAFARQVARARPTGDFVVLDSHAVPAVALGRAPGEVLGLGDGPQAGLVVLVATAETVSLSDASSRQATGYGRTADEALTLGNVFARQRALVRAVAQPLGVAEGWAIVRFAASGTSEGVQLVDDLTRSATSYIRAVAGPVALGNTIVRQAIDRGRAAGEAVEFAEVWLAARQIIPSTLVSEMAFSDVNAPTVARGRAAAEAVAFGHGFGRRIDRARAVEQPLTIAELARAVRGQNLGAGASVVIEDAAIAAAAKAVGWGETLWLLQVAGIGDQTSVILVAHPHRVRMTTPPRGRVWMSRG
jgi:hypothetical protein